MRSVSLFAVLALTLLLAASSAAYAQPPPIWSDPVDTNDIALSADGQYVVVGTDEGVRFYGRSSPIPLWIYSGGTTITSVAISADGSYAAAGTLGKIYFWADAKSLTGNPPPTWTSVQVTGGYFEHRCLAISADGNYVAACGTGENVFYWADATGKSGSNIATTWMEYLADQVEAIAISDDGNHVAAAGFDVNEGSEGVLGYWNNAISLTGHSKPTWKGQVTDEAFGDVAISNDGNYVAVAGGAPVGTSTVYYWAGATTRSTLSESYTWFGGVDIISTSVDMSCDGDSVIAGARIQDTGLPTGSVYFWGGATNLSGNPAPSWTYPTVAPVEDVAINDAGTYMAAVDYEIPDTLYFFDRQGNVLWQDVHISGQVLSISCDGRTLAVGHYPEDTAYLLDTGYSSPCCGEVEPVGGVVMPANNLAIAAPWLAFIGLVGCIGTVVVVRKKRHP
jgi:WD40 repeat protein